MAGCSRGGVIRIRRKARSCSPPVKLTVPTQYINRQPEGADLVSVDTWPK